MRVVLSAPEAASFHCRRDRKSAISGAAGRSLDDKTVVKQEALLLLTINNVCRLPKVDPLIISSL